MTNMNSKDVRYLQVAERFMSQENLYLSNSLGQVWGIFFHQPPVSFATSFAAVATAAASRGRGRGRGQAINRGGQVSGRGRGRGGVNTNTNTNVNTNTNTNTKAVNSVSDFLISSQSTRSSQSRKRGEISPVNEW